MHAHRQQKNDQGTGKHLDNIKQTMHKALNKWHTKTQAINRSILSTLNSETFQYLDD